MIRAKQIDFINHEITDLTTAYDPDKLNLGSIIKRYTGPNPEDKYVGPAGIGLARPMEASTPIPAVYPHVYVYNQDVDLIFCADNATASASRRVVLFEHDKNNSIFAWKGFITLNIPPLATAHTIRGFRMSIEHYSTGTVSTSGNTVTGVDTLFQISRLSIGSRIGFGSTDPKLITTWYEITSIINDTTILLDSTPPTVSPGSTYVIEDMIAIISTTNATATNGGLFVAKGLRYELFTPTGTTIAAATTADNQRAVYWLADAATVTNTTACGCAIEDMISWTEQYLYVPNVTGARIFKYNLRASLTSIAAGKTTSAFVFATGNQAVTGTMSQTNNGRIVTASHGPGSGIPSLYFVTTTRIYRSALTAITSGSITWQTDVMLEIPPGSINTHAASALISSIEYSSLLDRFFIMTTGAGGVRSYCTKYNTNSDQMDHIFLIDSKQIDQSTASQDAPVHPAILALPFSAWIEGRVLYLARIGTTVAQNHIYSIPVSAHQTYAFDTNQYIITPKIDISDSNKLYTFYTKSIIRLGTDTFSLQTEPFRVYYRTSGIADNSGSWTQLSDNGDLSGITGTEIQFAYTFKILGTTCIPGRLINCALIYEDQSTDSHYQPSYNKSSLTNRIFAYIQTSSFPGGIIPPLKIKIFNRDTLTLVLEDTTTSQTSGTFQYSTDGTTWLTWDNMADNPGNYIRYTADSLPSSVSLSATLIQE